MLHREGRLANRDRGARGRSGTAPPCRRAVFRAPVRPGRALVAAGHAPVAARAVSACGVPAYGILAGGVLACAALAFAHPATAQEPEAAQHQSQDHAQGAHGYKNEVALFMGNTNRDGRDAFTVGLDYARELSPLLAIGVFFDRATGSRGRAWVLGLPLYIETGIGHLSATLGVGVEKESALDESDPAHGETAGEEHEPGTLMMGRMGAQYPLHFGSGGRLFVAPQVNYDVTREHGAWVLGVIGGFVF